jgi:hypothetical protein
MAYIPKDAKWYIADIILEIRIKNEPRNIVHTNTVLIRADSPNEAFDKAEELGAEAETSYENSEGNLVVISYRGLRSLNVIHDELEHGAELAYQEDVEVSEEKIRSWISSREELGVFAPIVSSENKPNYIAESVVKALEERGFSRDELT